MYVACFPPLWWRLLFTDSFDLSRRFTRLVVLLLLTQQSIHLRNSSPRAFRRLAVEQHMSEPQIQAPSASQSVLQSTPALQNIVNLPCHGYHISLLSWLSRLETTSRRYKATQQVSMRIKINTSHILGLLSWISRLEVLLLYLIKCYPQPFKCRDIHSIKWSLWHSRNRSLDPLSSSSAHIWS